MAVYLESSTEKVGFNTGLLQHMGTLGTFATLPVGPTMHCRYEPQGNVVVPVTAAERGGVGGGREAKFLAFYQDTNFQQ